MKIVYGACCLVLALLAAAAEADAQNAAAGERPVIFRTVGVEESLDEAPVLAAAIDAAALGKGPLPVFVRLTVGALDGAAMSRLDARVGLYAARQVPVFLVFSVLPPSDAADPWRQAVRGLADRFRGRVAGYQVGVPGALPAEPASYAFLVKLAAVQVRSVDPAALLAVAAPASDVAAWLDRLFAEDVAPYLDVVAVEGAGSVPSASRHGEIDVVLQRRDPSAAIMQTGLATSQQPAGAARDVVDIELARIGTKVAASSYRATGRALQAILGRVAALADIVAAELVPLDAQTTAFSIRQGDVDRTGAVRHRLLYNVGTLGPLIVYWGWSGATGTVQFELNDVSYPVPFVRDALRRGADPVAGVVRDEAQRRIRFTVPIAAAPFLVDFTFGEANTFALREEATERATLAVEEIIARHQQTIASQDRLLDHYAASARMEQHFKPPSTESFDVLADTRFYFDRDGYEFEELSWSLNGTKWGADRPAFPLLQPEKVLSLPLDLRLTSDYTYELDGEETVDGQACYVVRFNPIAPGRSLYRGRIWIATDTFARIKVHAVQTEMAAPVVSNEEIQTYTAVADGEGRRLFLLQRSTSRQIFLIAGRNILVEKETRFTDFQVNGADFDEKRAGARASDRIMYRDTDQGLRHFVKRGDQRVVSDRLTSSAKALAMGTLVDPSLDFPLPIFGINYLDFDFIGGDTQFALLFGGVLALGNVQAPKFAGTPLDASVDFFVFAVPVLDQEFDTSGPKRGERIRNIPFSTGANLGWQFDPYQKIGGGYQLRYDIYFADGDTAPGFEAPSDTLTHGLGLSYEYKRAGYSFAASGWVHHRSRWHPWGDVATFDPRTESYRKYSASLSKDFYVGPFQKIHLNGAWFGGSRLDRFSMYQFGIFDETRMHGVPSAGLRFADLAVARGSYTFNIFEQYRLDLFLDHAYGRDLAEPDRWQAVTGLGVAFNFRGPRHTMIRTDLGKSFLPDKYSGSGSMTFQIMVLKPL